MAVINSNNRLTHNVYSAGVLTDPTSITLAVYDETGTAIWSPATKTPTKLSTGVYYYDLAPTDVNTAGKYKAVWTTVIAGSTLAETVYFDVNLKAGTWTNPAAVKLALAPTQTDYIDDKIQALIDEAQNIIERETGLRYGQFYATLYYDGNGQRCLFLPPGEVNGRINSITSIGIDEDGLGTYTTLNSNEYRVLEDECGLEVWLEYATNLAVWPKGTDSVKIVGDFGEDPPETAQRAVNLLAARNILAQSQTRHEKERDLDLADQAFEGESPANTSVPTGVPEVDKLIAVLRKTKQPGVYSV